ncbi:hypothetical protein M8J76_000111 [Diaphorina citri]|nr:hypothetical protein M8J76_000111 [Diaphorina citri]
MLKVVGASWVQTRVSWCLLVSISLLGLVALYLGPSYSAEPDGKYAATVFYGKESKFRLEYWGQNNNPEDIKKGVARGFYQPDISKTGWATLEIETQETYSDTIQACAAGMLEGALSWQMIQHHWQNTIQKTCNGRQEFCARTRDYLRENMETVRKTAERFDTIDPFWHQVHLFYIQLEGIEVGWRSGIRRSRREYPEIPKIDFLWMNVMPDLRDLERKFNGTADFNPYRPPLSFAMLTYFPDNPSNYILAHGSSGTYNSMLRIQKRYNFAYHSTGDVDSDLVNGRIQTFSSYPGTIFSGDDYYQVRSITGETLTIVGTELKNHNQSTWNYDDIETEYPVLMGPRVMAANRLSRDGDDWSALFTRRNSGTGNKQWLIIDTSENFTVWAVEQMPGLTHAQEVTQHIIDDRYWIACGIPYFQDILMQSQGTDGSSLYHLKNVNPLYVTLKKYAANITSVETVIDMVRSYDISVIGRTDLNGNSNLYGYLNVTHSISRHHSHHTHHHKESARDEIVYREGLDRHEVEDKKESVTQDTEVITTNTPDGEITPGRFHNVHYYEHEHALAMQYEANPLIVEANNDQPQTDVDSSGKVNEENQNMDDRWVDSVTQGVDSVYGNVEKRHKYAGVHGMSRDRSDEHNRVLGDELNETRDSRNMNDLPQAFDKSRESNALNSSSNESSELPGSSRSQSFEDNQTSSSTKSQEYDTSKRSQNSNSNSFSQSSSSSSSAPSSFKSIETNNHEPKPLDQMLRVNLSKSNAIESSETQSRTPSSSEQDQLISANMNSASTTSKAFVKSTVPPPTRDLAPRIDIQFKAVKDLLHSKPSEVVKSTAVGAGLGFRNMTKQFRGIIDVKINQGDADFIAISGPPYYRPKSAPNSTKNELKATNLLTNSTAKTQSFTSSPEQSSAAGPSTNVEPFQWSKSFIKHQQHIGHPDLWDFDQFKATWVWS